MSVYYDAENTNTIRSIYLIMSQNCVHLVKIVRISIHKLERNLEFNLREKKALITCTLYSEGNECVRAEVMAVRVPAGKGPKR